MSDPRFSIIQARAIYDNRLSPLDVRVLGVFGGRSDRQGWCYGNQGKIAARLGVARTSVNASIKRLATFGYLQVVSRKMEGRGQITNLYRVLLDTAFAEPIVDVFDDDPPVSLDDIPLSAQTTGLDVVFVSEVETLNADPLSAQTTAPLSSPHDTINVPSNVSLPSKEERETSKLADEKSHATFELTPSANEPKKARRGRAAVPMTQPPMAVEFYEKMRAADFFTALPATIRSRTHRAPAIEALGVVLANHDRDLVARVVAAYYKGQGKKNNGENARGLQNLIRDGDLEDLIRDAARKTNIVTLNGKPPVDEQVKRLRAPAWRSTWGERDGPDYDAGRAAMAAASAPKGEGRHAARS